MAEITNKELLDKIKTLVVNPGSMELERVNEFGPGGQVAFCCGCICVSYCAFNSSASIRDLRILVEKGEIELPVTLSKMLNAEINKK